MTLPEQGDVSIMHLGFIISLYLIVPSSQLNRFLNRWLQATKSIISGTNTQALTAKADSLKEEVDEAMNKMELCKVLMCKQV